jgi:hypothetical protein
MDDDLTLDLHAALAEGVSVLGDIPQAIRGQASSDQHTAACIELSGLFEVCAEDIKALCEHGKGCHGCKLSHNMQTLAGYMQAVTGRVLCATLAVAAVCTIALVMHMCSSLRQARSCRGVRGFTRHRTKNAGPGRILDSLHVMV